MADGDYLSKRLDIERIFGKNNVLRWADPDNEEVTLDIEDRIDIANRDAEDEFMSLILDGPYDVEEILSVKPHIAIRIAATRAGLFLYEARRIVDEPDQTDEVNDHRKNWNMWTRQISAGQIKFRHPTTKEPLTRVSGNAPNVVSS